MIAIELMIKTRIFYRNSVCGKMSGFNLSFVVSSCRRRPERLEFLYDPELAVAKQNVSSSRHGVLFQNQDQRARATIPGALFDDDDKRHSANDSWRKFHSDPLLLIRQKEQEIWKFLSLFLYSIHVSCLCFFCKRLRF